MTQGELGRVYTIIDKLCVCVREGGMEREGEG